MMEAASLTTAYKAASMHAACCKPQHRILQTAITKQMAVANQQIMQLLLLIEAIYNCC